MTTDVRFQSVTCTSEAGVLMAGLVDSTIEGQVPGNVGMELMQQTDFVRRSPEHQQRALKPSHGLRRLAQSRTRGFRT